MSPNAWDHYLEKLCEDGFVHIPNFLAPPLLDEVQAAVGDAFAEAPYGRNERSGEPEEATRLVGLGKDVDILPIVQLRNRSLNTVPIDPNLRRIMGHLLGDDFYLDRSVVRRARGRCDRFYFHKDQHGDIGLTVLLNDLGPDEGATTVLPGRFLTTPPTVFAVRNINDAQPDEVQMTGRAGDAYLFFRDIDHSRAQNETEKANVQLILTFTNKNTFPAAHSRQGVNAGHLEGTPDAFRHMLRPYDGLPLDAPKGVVEKIIYGSGFSSPGAGDYDLRNDLFRDVLYNMFYVTGRPMRVGKDAALPRNTTTLNEARRFSLIRYAMELNWWLVIRSHLLRLLRGFSLGRAMVDFLKKTPVSPGRQNPAE